MTRAQPLRSLRERRREAEAAEAGAGESSRRWSREWIYFTLISAAWCFTPLVRRLIDFRNGAFNPVTVTSLIPYALLVPLVFVCFRPERRARMTPLFRNLAYIWVGAFIYGALIAGAVGSLGAAAFELVQFLTPMLAGIWLAGQELDVTRALRRVSVIILPLAGVVAVYGLFQWLQPPPWDVLWVQGSDFVSVGSPTPFAMRVFATLNAPGPAADFFTLTILLALPFLRIKRLWAWPLVIALGAALLLTMIREAWVGLLVGMIVYLLLSPKRFTAVPSLAAFAAVIAFLVVSLPALLGSGANSDIISTRISTLGDVGHDESALTRQSEISDALAQGLANPVGEGLGEIGAAAKLGANPASAIGNVLDSGYLSRLLELGWPGTLGYVCVTLGGPILFAYEILRSKTADVDAKVAGMTAVALCAALAWGDAANDAHLGLEGFFFWLALALASLALQPPRSAATVSETSKRRA
jgi:hypothetical protein